MDKVNVIIYIDNVRYVDTAALSRTLSNLNGYCQVTVINDNCSDEDDPLIRKTFPAETISIQYVRNSKFKGFSESCNYAVHSYMDNNDVLFMTGGYLLNRADIKEMLRILNESEHIGAVIPRSNCGLFSRYPYINKADIKAEDIVRSNTCYVNTNQYLKDYNTVPYPDNTVILYKKLLLDNWGDLCGSINSPIIAIRALCEDLNRPGFSTVVANHSYVPCYREYVSPYDDQEQWVIDKCYGYLDKVADAYEDMSGFYNVFSRVLDPEYYSKQKVLIAIMDVPKDITILDYIDNLVETINNYEITILTTEETDKALSLSDRYRDVMYYNNIEGQFHAGIIFMESFFPEIFYIACKVCMKLAVIYYDRSVIDCRIDTLDKAFSFRMQKSIYQTVDMVIFDNSIVQNELDMIFGNNKRVCNIRELIDRQNKDWLAASISRLLNAPLDALRIQQINVVQKYIWSAMSGFNNMRAKYSQDYSSIVAINNIVRLSADSTTKLEAIKGLQMEK